MASLDSRADAPRESVLHSVDLVTDVVDSVKQYARQETIEPLRGAGRWLASGILAALSLGLAVTFGVLGVLRVSQDLGKNVFDGSWSWVPYLIALCVNVVLVVVAFSRINDAPLSKGTNRGG